MKLIHLSDLHLGKRLNEFSMIEDQKYIITKIINIIDDEKPDGILIAGDIYDKSVPSAEAVEIFDDFLVRLAKRNIQVFVISGNHDSPERLAFGNRLINASGIHLSPVYNGTVEPISLNDEHGEVKIFMLPFVKPANVRRLFSDVAIESYTDALRTAVENISADFSERNVLITHQFVTGAARCESEDISVGGSDNIDASVFDGFDYVALGHIHAPQNIGSKRLRYSGTPLKYSFSEVTHKKSVTVVELGNKGELCVRTVPLAARRDMVEIKGTYDELTLKSYYENTTYQDDYMHIILTDEEDIPNAIGKLRVIYRNIMKLDYDNKRTRSNVQINGADSIESKSKFDLFAEFYEMQNNALMSDEQMSYMKQMIEKIEEVDQ